MGGRWCVQSQPFPLGGYTPVFPYIQSENGLAIIISLQTLGFPSTPPGKNGIHPVSCTG